MLYKKIIKRINMISEIKNTIDPLTKIETPFLLNIEIKP
jgi:hypothetical protein